MEDPAFRNCHNYSATGPKRNASFKVIKQLPDGLEPNK